MPADSRAATEPLRHTVRAPDGTRLSVLVAVPPQGVPVAAGLPPVLAVHGFASSAAANWRRTGHLDTLTRAGRMVIAPDLRGHGHSDRPHRTDAYTLDGMLADLVAVATDRTVVGHHRVTGIAAVTGTTDASGPAAIDLLGYSLGARLCWTVALRRLLPVRRIVLGGFDGRPLFQGVDADRLDRLASGVPDNDRVALRHLVAGLAGTGGTPDTEPLPGVPVLLVAGDRDPLASDAREFAGRLPDGSFLPVPGRHHISAVPAAAFRQGTVRFLGRP